ncbi:hypothetical protein [Ancylobacter moscoviensis]
MKIISIRPAPPGTGTLAHFDLELSADVRVLDVTLNRNRLGQLRVWPPRSGDRRIISFSPALSDSIAAAAEAALRGADAQDNLAA